MRWVLQHKTPMAIILGLIVLIATGIWFWEVLVGYVDPGTKGSTDRKDVVQAFALIIAGVVGLIGGIVGIVNLSVARQNLKQQIEFEETRRQTAYEIEDGRRQDAVLQAYFEQMGDLLTDHDLINTDREDTRQLARAQTLTVLARLNGPQKGALVRFLYGARLIVRDKAIVGLAGANLVGADLINVQHRAVQHLEKAELAYVDLSNARLDGANLNDANLNGTRLVEAELPNASLWNAALFGARLNKANLSHAQLPRADLNGASLNGANLKHARLDGARLYTADLSDACLRDANLLGAYFRPSRRDHTIGRRPRYYARLTGADLSGAHLYGAHLDRVDLGGAILTGADLTNVDLTEADLKDAKVTKEQLAVCESLEGATMPNGQKYEDWLKTKEGQDWLNKYKKGPAEGGKNSGPS